MQISELKIESFLRKPFQVEAVFVTEDNLDAVADWCGGDVRTVEDQPERYIKVKVQRPLNEKQTRAFPGDWVLEFGGGFKVYTEKAFEKVFTPLVEDIDLNEYVGLVDAERPEFKKIAPAFVTYQGGE